MTDKIWRLRYFSSSQNCIIQSSDLINSLFNYNFVTLATSYSFRITMSNQSSGRPGENKRRSNMSLPDRTIPLEDLSAKVRRNTITESNVATVRKKAKAPLTPTIHEDDTSEPDQNPVFSVENETRKIARYVFNGDTLYITSHHPVYNNYNDKSVNYE